jgi:hypothetical protein
VVSNPDTPRNTAATFSPCGCSTSYSSLFSLGSDSWKEIVAGLFVDDLSAPLCGGGPVSREF